MTDAGSANVLKYLRFMPQLRSAYVERFEGSPRSLTLYINEEYLDASLLDTRHYRKVRRLEMVSIALRGDFDVIALPEPLWIVNLPFSSLLAFLAKANGWATRRPKAVVTYAIENAASERLLGLSDRIPARVRLMLLRIVAGPYLLLLDRIAFGTDGAKQNYRDGVMKWMRRRVRERTRSFSPLAPLCDCPPADRNPSRVLFLGPLATRKGFDSLLEAWPEIAALSPDAELVVCGTGALQSQLDGALAEHANITQVVTHDRSEMHMLLRSAGVLISLPRSERRWREQIGLSLTEGVSHASTVVTTDQTGFADWLAENGHVVLANTSPPAVAEGVRSALAAPAGAGTLPEISGRASAEQWMVGAALENGRH